MDQSALVRLLGAGSITAEDLLGQAQFDELGDVLALLKRCRPAEEVRAAFLQRIATAPLAEFNALKVMYFRYFDEREH